ncbi:hypothetical protein CP965_12715 [Halarcobacter mediterraneus]|uniref:PIR Superfamily Protein n=1 Tax=Halarcobacter mediterraneus TaxID=2023153 RepID=A0A4Q1B1H6_9BACT|nr:hypothetical protein [Halarcobacter mediterraneus]RXK11627.1 hypothetical protein CP965_12715 [Halarcobacter mediterraneus]
MNTLELIKKLSVWEYNLKEYKECFEKNKDLENSKEVEKFLNTIDEFISYYEINKNDDTKYNYALQYWIKSNEKYLQLLKNLYIAYKKSPLK